MRRAKNDIIFLIGFNLILQLTFFRRVLFQWPLRSQQVEFFDSLLGLFPFRVPKISIYSSSAIIIVMMIINFFFFYFNSFLEVYI